jgi:hypothetical protein
MRGTVVTLGSIMKDCHTICSKQISLLALQQKHVHFTVLEFGQCDCTGQRGNSYSMNNPFIMICNAYYIFKAFYNVIFVPPSERSK